MNAENVKRIAIIAAKKAINEYDEATRKAQEESMLKAAEEKILSMKDRIQDLITVGNALYDGGFLFVENGCSGYWKSISLINYGYNGFVVNSHDGKTVGLFPGYSMPKDNPIHYLSMFVNDCAYLRTDGNTVEIYNQYNEKRKSLKEFERFLVEFPKFESAFYKWFDENFKI